MTERSKWSEPAGIASAVGIILAVSGLIWAGGAISNSNSTQAANFDRLQTNVTAGFQAIQAQIASLPTQGVRLDAVEHGLSDMRQDNIQQAVAIGALQRAQAVLVSTTDTIKHDVQVLQDAANGRLPGGRR